MNFQDTLFTTDVGERLVATLSEVRDVLLLSNTKLNTIHVNVDSVDQLVSSLDEKTEFVNTNAVVVSSCSLPADAARSSIQLATNELITKFSDKVTKCDTNAVTIASSALPDGASTSLLQEELNSLFLSLNTKVSACDTDNVRVVSSVLPVDAAKATLQTIGNQMLTALNSKIVTCDTSALVISKMPLPAGAARADLQSELNTEIKVIHELLRPVIVALNELNAKNLYTNTNAVHVKTTVLPDGSATAANQSTTNQILEQLHTNTTNLNSITKIMNEKITKCDTSAITIASVPLPPGASTAANQSAANATFDQLLTRSTALFNTSLSMKDLLDKISLNTASTASCLKFCDTNNVIMKQIPLAENASTAALQKVNNDLLIIGNQQTRDLLTIGTQMNDKMVRCDTNSVRVVTCPLPTGAATTALQTIGNQSIAAINDKLNTLTETLTNKPMKKTGFISRVNSTNEPLNAYSSFTGGFESVVEYQMVLIITNADQPLDLFVDFASDPGSLLSTTKYTNHTSNHVYVPVKGPFVRVRLVNTNTAKAMVNLQTLIGNYKPEVQECRAVITGGQLDAIVKYDNSLTKTAPAYAEHLIHQYTFNGTDQPDPDQHFYIYELNDTVDFEPHLKITGTSAVTSRAALSVPLGSYASWRFTAQVGSGLVGVGSRAFGVFFGSDSVVHTHSGAQECWSLSFDTVDHLAPCQTGTLLLLKLNDVQYEIPVSASGNLNRMIYEIFSYQYTGWSAELTNQKNTVLFKYYEPRVLTGTFSTSYGSLTKKTSGALNQTTTKHLPTLILTQTSRAQEYQINFKAPRSVQCLINGALVSEFQTEQDIYSMPFTALGSVEVFGLSGSYINKPVMGPVSIASTMRSGSSCVAIVYCMRDALLKSLRLVGSGLVSLIKNPAIRGNIAFDSVPGSSSFLLSNSIIQIPTSEYDRCVWRDLSTGSLAADVGIWLYAGDILAVCFASSPGPALGDVVLQLGV